MATLVSELVRVLSEAAARELRSRADGEALTRAEMLALATLSELASDYLAAGSAPETSADALDWDVLQSVATFDARLIAEGKARRARAT